MQLPPITNIPPQGRMLSPVSQPEAAKSVKLGNSSASSAASTQRAGRFDVNECQTCKTRKYQDESNDGGVSFKAATNINPKAVASAVAGHEMEHVSRESERAEEEGKQVVSQDVQIQTGVCPECHKVYVAGGTTTTTTKDKGSQNAGLNGPAAAQNAGLEDMLASVQP